MSKSIPIYQNKILYSLLSGHNFYRITDSPNNKKYINALQIKDDIHTDIRIVDNTRLNTNISLDLWRKYISEPPGSANILWPVDIVDISTEQTTSSGLSGTFGLVFSKSKPFLNNEILLKDLIYDDSKLDWRDKHIQTVIIALLDELQCIYNFGYSLISFDSKKISYGYDINNKLRVLFDFPFSAIKLDQLNPYRNQKFLANDIYIDFIPPWWFKNNKENNDYNKRKKANVSVEYYSVAAILFRLMIGKMPYQGSLMGRVADGSYLMTPDDREEFHVNLMEQYIENPIFIFDENDKSNCIGDIGDDDIYVKRWNSLPDEVQQMFLNTFSKDNLTNYLKNLYTISDWKNVLEKLFQE